MDKIIKILMERDGLSYDGAKGILQNTAYSVYQFLDQGDLIGAEETFMDELGLEPDYMEELLYEYAERNM